MSKKEYEKAILDALSATSQSEDPISIIRAALNSCDAGFPYGDCRGILTDLSENDFTGWRACTYDDAKKFVGEGIPTVGINDDQLVLVAPDGSQKYDNNFICQANFLTPDEKLKFFAYSVPSWERAIDYGTTTDVPKNQTTDGFGGWYVPASGNKGVTGKVARFVQMKSGPCVAYSIMMGDYYLNYKASNPNAATWFTNNVNTYLDAGGATGYANSRITKTDYSLSRIKTQLNAGKPVVVEGWNGSTRHMALIVAYVSCGGNTSQFVVVDPYHSTVFPSKLSNFFATYSATKKIGTFND